MWHLRSVATFGKQHLWFAVHIWNGYTFKINLRKKINLKRMKDFYRHRNEPIELFESIWIVITRCHTHTIHISSIVSIHTRSVSANFEFLFEPIDLFLEQCIQKYRKYVVGMHLNRISLVLCVFFQLKWSLIVCKIEITVISNTGAPVPMVVIKYLIRCDSTKLRNH